MLHNHRLVRFHTTQQGRGAAQDVAQLGNGDVFVGQGAGFEVDEERGGVLQAAGEV